MRLQSWLLLSALSINACVPPDAAQAPSAEASDGAPQLELDPIGGMPSTTFRFTLNAVQGVEFWEPTQPTHDTGYVPLAALSVQVGKSTSPDIGSCVLTRPNNNTSDTMYSVCGAQGPTGPTPGPIAGQSLWRTATLTSPTDSVTGNNQVTLGVTLDNIENVDMSNIHSPTAFSQMSSTLSNAGNIAQGVGTLTGLGVPVFGAIVGVIGSGLSLAGGMFHDKQSGVYSCAGGLIGQPKNGVPTPSDYFTRTFSTQELLTITAAGPAQIWFDTGEVVWNDNQCHFRDILYITIERTWTDGLAAFAKSSDGAVVRTAGNVDQFEVNPFNNAVQHDWTSNGYAGGWSTELATPKNGNTLARADIAVSAISRSPANLDLFVANQYGAIAWSAWTAQSGAWTLNEVPTGILSYPYGAVSAVARTSNTIDLFFVDRDGKIESSSWQAGAANFTQSAPLPGASAALGSPGEHVAAVSRTPASIDVFWIGRDQANANQSALFYGSGLGSSWTISEVPYTAGIAPFGAPLTAVASSVGNLDVFYVGNDGGLRQTSWYNTSAGFATQTVAADFAPAGSLLSSVSQRPGQIDVATVAAAKVYRASERNNVWSTSVIAQPSPIALNGDNVALVAPDFGTLDVVWHDLIGRASSAWLPYGAPSWTSSGLLPDVCRPLTCATANASCGEVSDGCGGTLECGGCSALQVCSASTRTCQVPKHKL